MRLRSGQWVHDAVRVDIEFVIAPSDAGGEQAAAPGPENQQIAERQEPQIRQNRRSTPYPGRDMQSDSRDQEAAEKAPGRGGSRPRGRHESDAEHRQWKAEG